MRVLSLALVLGMLLTGCGLRQNQVAATPVPLATPPPIHAPPAVARLAAGLQRDYDLGSWDAVHSAIESQSAASALVAQMQSWKLRGVTSLRTALTYLQRQPRNSYVAEIRFAADRRAVPYYGFYLVHVARGQARIVRPDYGLTGSSYLLADWVVTRTAHFIVYHSPYQLVGADRSYLSALESQRQLFARRFRVKLPPLAVYYLYPTRELMRQLTNGGCGRNPGEFGCTTPFTQPPMIQAEIRATFHEPIHVYELSLEPKPQRTKRGVLYYVAPLFIGEGTAVALEDRELDPRLSDYCSDISYAPLDTCARASINDVDPMTLLADTGFKRSDATEAYSLGGSFVKYLILRYGYYRFGRFYYTLAAQPKDRVRDYNVATRAIFHLPIQTVINNWKQELCLSGC